jgi:arylsulfatase
MMQRTESIARRVRSFLKQMQAIGSMHVSILFHRLLAAVVAVGVGLTAGFTPAAERPNILIILADDLGYSDVGCYGGELRTPNLDALGAGGLRVTQFYNCTRCCPSRASLLTGLYPHQAGIGSMTADQGQPGYRGSLQPNCVTFAQVLKAAGYRTAMTGKWHVGDNVSPIDRGFDDFYGWTKGYAVNSWYPQMMIRLPAGRPQRTYKPGEYFATDAITDHALDFLAGMRGGGAPWLLYVAYQTPHFPLQTRSEDAGADWKQYAAGWDKLREERLARQKKLGLVPPETRLTPRSHIPLPAAAARHGSATEDGNNPPWDNLPAERQTDLALRMHVYAGMVEGMDRNIGRLVRDLREHAELGNTLILFMSDNGACAEWEPFGFDLPPIPPETVKPGVGINVGTPQAPNRLWKPEEVTEMAGERGMISYGSGWANASNTPWREYKHDCYEGGISAPLIVHWPARIQTGGQFRRQVGHLIDILPTCLEVAGASYPQELGGQKIDPPAGKSLLPTLADQPLERDYLAWEHEGNAAIRAGNWKLVRAGARGDWELYDIASDRTELKNVADQHPDRASQMAADWQAWAERTHVFPKPGGGKGKKK